jgi:hypothetical protein
MRASRETAVVGKEENIAAAIENTQCRSMQMGWLEYLFPFPVTDDRFFNADAGTGHQRHSDRRGAETEIDRSGSRMLPVS